MVDTMLIDFLILLLNPTIIHEISIMLLENRVSENLGSLAKVAWMVLSACAAEV